MRNTLAVLALACASLAAAGLQASPPDGSLETLPRSAPEAQGIPSAAVQAFLDQAEKKIDALHSLMIVRHGQVVAEGWWAPYAAEEPHMLFSLSKSFTSTAVGLVIADGKLSLDDPVLKFFPEDAPPEPSANLKAMRVRDLLTMSTGQHDEDMKDISYANDENLVRTFLSRKVAHKPGTHFWYNTPATYMLSAIVQKVTGQTVLDYLGPRLFAPLGITGHTWQASRQGISMGGFGLSVRTEDIARFGQLYLQKGKWHGKPLVPADWVEMATSRQVSNGSSPSSDWEQGYGFQFWRSRHGFYRGDGAHGQFCLVLPQHDTVIAITSGTRDMAGVMNVVWDTLVPALAKGPLPADAAAARALAARLSSLTLTPAAAAPGVTAAAGPGLFTFASNPKDMEWLRFEPAAGGSAAITVRTAGKERRIAASSGVWSKVSGPGEDPADPAAASAGWTAADTYRLKVVRYRTPFATTFTLKFAGDRLTLDAEENVGNADTRTWQLTGSRSNGGGPVTGNP